ncbi:hypothetical protein [Neptunomonas marina]|nr:hypothetical protein [Neptunomonas marina]
MDNAIPVRAVTHTTQGIPNDDGFRAIAHRGDALNLSLGTIL